MRKFFMKHSTKIYGVLIGIFILGIFFLSILQMQHEKIEYRDTYMTLCQNAGHTLQECEFQYFKD